MNTNTTNEGVMNKNSQPSKNGNKGSITDMSTLMMYEENQHLLLNLLELI